MPRPMMSVSIPGDEDTESSVMIPYTWAICSRCNGHGTHVAPGIDDNGITQSEMAELGEDFEEGYFSGRYDVSCVDCGGKGKEQEMDTEYFRTKYPKEYAAWDESRIRRATYDREAAWERKMGY